MTYIFVCRIGPSGGRAPPRLSPEAVKHIVERNIARGPTAHEVAKALPTIMSMVVDVQNIEAGKLKNPSVYEAGSLMLRKMLVPQPLFVRPNGTPLFTLKEHMGLEACLMPYMFPYGLGSYVDSDKKFSYAEYLRFRMKTLLSPWTLVKPYLLFGYQIRQVN